jgi:toxin FitB
MIILDTNVISEAMKLAPDTRVREWLDRQASDTLYLTAITQAELLFGVASLPSGKRKDRLAVLVSGFEILFAERILAFDSDAARHYGELAATARAAGRGFPTPDGYIAAIAASHGFAVATRDAAPFVAVGVAVIDPWNDA